MSEPALQVQTRAWDRAQASDRQFQNRILNAKRKKLMRVERGLIHVSSHNY